MSNSKKLVEGFDKAFKRLNEHLDWLESLSEIDRMNFTTLCGLSNAKELIDRLDEGKYKEEALIHYRFLKEKVGEE